MKPAARALLTKGLRAYEVQRYAEAIESFREGYQLDPRPEFLYALGQAERMSGDCRRAIEAYRAFLRSGPTAVQAGSAEKNIARCESQLAAAPPAEPSPAPAAVTLVGAGPPRPQPTWARTVGHVLVGFGVATIAAGGALWGIGQSQLDAVDAADRYDRFVAARAAAGNAEGERTAGIVWVAVGGAALVGAVIHYAAWPRGN
jgi:tetratricopeptide (TPR) repeat protein